MFDGEIWRTAVEVKVDGSGVSPPTSAEQFCF